MLTKKHVCANAHIQGTARRKKKVVHRTATADDKKLQFSLKKLGVNNISGIEEVGHKSLLSYSFACDFSYMHQYRLSFLSLRMGNLFWLVPGQHVYKSRNSHPFQQSQSAGLPRCQHLHHHRPRWDQTADWDAARHLEPAGSRQLDEPQETRRGSAQARSVASSYNVACGWPHFRLWACLVRLLAVFRYPLVSVNLTHFMVSASCLLAQLFFVRVNVSNA